jgi:hypothetical protein
MLSRMSLTFPRLIAGAAVLHLFLAVALFVVGRAGVAPALIDRDGIMGSFAFDSYNYQRGAIETAELLRSGNIVGWATAAQPPHVKIIAVPFALLSPLFGYGTLSAEPYNLVCYLAIVALVFALGRELGGQRAGVPAAAIVGLWPTFLLHTLQLLKDPIFVMAALAFLWCAITLLVRTYSPTASAGVSLVATLLVLLLALVRFSVAWLMIAVALLILVLLILRQTRERRLLFWNMAPVIAILLTGLIMPPLHSLQTIERTKTYLSDEAGPPKNVADPAMQMPTVVKWIDSPQRDRGARFARRVSSIRSRFAAVYSDSGSLVDAQAEFRNVGDLLRYIPRAFAVGMWAPFPSMWVSSGKQVGNIGKMISGLETLAIYFLQLFAVVAIVREPRRLALWFVLAIVVCGVTALAFIVPNVGAIYRFRYVFWMLLVVAATIGLNTSILTQDNWKRLLIAISTSCMLVVAQGCSSPPRKVDTVAITNFTGTSFRAVYVSPSTSNRWQENVLAIFELEDGDTLNLQFDPKGKNVEWDMKVEGVDGRYAEWKKLKFDGVSEITLVLKLSSTPVVVAEVE